MEFKAICVDLGGVSLSKNELKEEDGPFMMTKSVDGTIGEDEFVNWFVNR